MSVRNRKNTVHAVKKTCLISLENGVVRDAYPRTTIRH